MATNQDRSKVYRLRGLPDRPDFDRLAATQLFASAINDPALTADDIQICSLATTVEPHKSWNRKVATVMFRRTPSALSIANNVDSSALPEWRFPVPGFNEPLVLDTHFLGLTVLNDVSTVEHRFDCIALSGLASHPFGSWQPKGDDKSYMWIRDTLATRMDGVRYILFGYDTTLICSDSFQTIADLANSLYLTLHVWTSQTTKPLIFLAHSLGGVLLKRLLVTLEGGNQRTQALLSMIKGAIFFGTPSRGMAMEQLLTMVGDQPNRDLVMHLSKDSEFLPTLETQFAGISYVQRMRLYWAYETRTSPTVQMINGLYKRSGPRHIMVDPQSATGGRILDPSFTIQIDEDHSNMVKFNRDDRRIPILVKKIQEMCSTLDTTFVVGPIAPVPNTVPQRPICTEACPRQQDFQGHACKKTVSGHDEEKAREKLRKDVLKRIKTAPYEERKNRNPKRANGTCEWFTAHDLFQKWQNEASAPLWVSADPGCGKSVLARYLVDDIVPSTGTRRTCYFFFKDDFEDQRTAGGAISCILHQIFVQEPALLSNEILDEFGEDGDQHLASFQRLWDLLLNVTRKYPHGEIVCILDALDECEGHAELTEALTKLYSCGQGLCKLKFLVTSRPYRVHSREFEPLIQDQPTVHLCGEDQVEVDKIALEIAAAIKQRTDDLCTRIPFFMEEKDTLEEELEKTDQRTYLWVHLAFTHMENAVFYTRQDLRNCIRDLPQTVEEAYEKILCKTPDRNMARKILHFVLAADRPLTITEMTTVLAFRDYHQRLADLERDILSEESLIHAIRETCGLFIVMKDSKIYFLHQTAREFLISSDKQFPSNCWQHSFDIRASHYKLANVCIRYLLFPDVQRETLGTESVTHKGGRSRLLKYAAAKWTTHYSEADEKATELQPLALRLCSPKNPFFPVWIHINRGTFCEQYQWFDSIHYLETPLLIAADCGLHNLVNYIVDETEKSFREKYKASGDQQRALGLACRRGHESVVETLLKRATQQKTFGLWSTGVNEKDDNGLTPLWYAVERGHTGIVKQLLEKGANVDAKSASGQTLWSLATENPGNNEIQELLVNYGVKQKIGVKRAGAKVFPGYTSPQSAIKTRSGVTSQNLMRHIADADADSGYFAEDDSIVHSVADLENDHIPDAFPGFAASTISIDSDAADTDNNLSPDAYPGCTARKTTSILHNTADEEDSTSTDVCPDCTAKATAANQDNDASTDACPGCTAKAVPIDDTARTANDEDHDVSTDACPGCTARAYNSDTDNGSLIEAEYSSDAASVAALEEASTDADPGCVDELARRIKTSSVAADNVPINGSLLEAEEVAEEEEASTGACPGCTSGTDYQRGVVDGCPGCLSKLAETMTSSIAADNVPINGSPLEAEVAEEEDSNGACPGCTARAYNSDTDGGSLIEAEYSSDAASLAASEEASTDACPGCI